MFLRTPISEWKVLEILKRTQESRQVRVNPLSASVRRCDNGTTYVSCGPEIKSLVSNITQKLDYWAAHAPDRTFLAERACDGSWRTITYFETLTRVRRIAQSLLRRNLSVDRPVAILSGNSIEHALLGLACMYIGVVYAPIAPAYCLAAREYSTLNLLWSNFRPKLVFADEGARFERALLNVCLNGIEVVTLSSRPSKIVSNHFSHLEGCAETGEVDRANRAVGPDTIAKVMFTSGSTGSPKGVINTQRMLCSNQEMIRSVVAFLQDDPPVLCDWLPWNHTFGGNHNFGIALYNGGTLYIDGGKPTADQFHTTVRNLRDVSTTAYFNVPKGYEMLVNELRKDPCLRERFFHRLQLMFCAAAPLGQGVWDELKRLAEETCGQHVFMMTGLGATESSPAAFFTTTPNPSADMIGLPLPGVEVKLVPAGGKTEGRLRGPNITPGFWRQPGLTADAYDEEGFYKLGDALKFADPQNPQKGLLFEGRLTEDFKLSTATWVSVGPLRAKLMSYLGSLAQDVVLAAPGADFIGALIFPNISVCRELVGVGGDLPVKDLLMHPLVRCLFEASLIRFGEQSTGSSTRVSRAILLEELPSIDRGEVTDKGTVSQKAVLFNRAAVVRELYKAPPPAEVIEIDSKLAENG
jgi:feruloyl-CoA synthase